MNEIQKEGKGNEENSQLGVRNFLFFFSCFHVVRLFMGNLHPECVCVYVLGSGQIVSREPVEKTMKM